MHTTFSTALGASLVFSARHKKLDSIRDNVVMEMANRFVALQDAIILSHETKKSSVQLLRRFGGTVTDLDYAALGGERMSGDALKNLLNKNYDTDMWDIRHKFLGYKGPAIFKKKANKQYLSNLRDVGLYDGDSFTAQIRQSIGVRLKLAHIRTGKCVGRAAKSLAAIKAEIGRLRRLLDAFNWNKQSIAQPTAGKNHQKMVTTVSTPQFDNLPWELSTTRRPRTSKPPLTSRPCAHVKGAKAFPG